MIIMELHELKALKNILESDRNKFYNIQKAVDSKITEVSSDEETNEMIGNEFYDVVVALERVMFFIDEELIVKEGR
jgi:hypothetical protein